MKVSDILEPGNVVIGIAAPSKPRLLQLLSAKAGVALGVDEATILAALDSRERLGSTGMGQGIAIPHTAIAGLKRPFCLLARLNRPVDFEAIDEAPVDVVFLLLIPGDDRPLGLKALSCAARLLRSDAFMKTVRAADSAAEIYAAIVEEGARLSE